MMWRLDYAKIEKSLKKHMQDAQVSKNLRTFIDDVKSLSDDANPETLGTKKVHALKGQCARSLSSSVRLTFIVNHKSHTVVLQKLGDHKKVYRKG